MLQGFHYCDTRVPGVWHARFFQLARNRGSLEIASSPCISRARFNVALQSYISNTMVWDFVSCVQSPPHECRLVGRCRLTSANIRVQTRKKCDNRNKERKRNEGKGH